MTDFGICLYRGGSGLKCTVGKLIPDEFYKKAMEGKCINAIWHTYPEMAMLFEEGSLYLLASLQAAHDHAEPERWMEELKQIQREYGLK